MIDASGVNEAYDRIGVGEVRYRAVVDLDIGADLASIRNGGRHL